MTSRHSKLTHHIALSLALFSSLSNAAGLSGGPRVDFQLNELQIPCVEVKNLSPDLNGKFFDVILDRRGSSMNFELKLADVADPAQCRMAADYSQFIDDTVTGPKVFVRCEIRPGRSQVAVSANNLPAGNYAAEISSGNNRAKSPLRALEGDEAEFEFTSQTVEIAQGATAIAADFIQGSVTAKILDAANNVVASVSDAACLSRPIATTQPTPPQPTPQPTAPRGAQLYATHCASCHNASPDKNALNAANRPAKILSAIQANKGGMGILQGRLSNADLDAIAAFLAGR